MRVVISVLFVLCKVTYAADHFTNCNWVLHHQCDGFSMSQLCGMDGVTYDNRCYFAKAYCRDMSLHVANEGPCFNSGTGSIGTTVNPNGTSINATTKPPLYTGTDAVLDFFCTLLSHEICTSTKDEICGSDNVTYTNPCEFEKERCSHRDLHVLNFGHC